MSNHEILRIHKVAETPDDPDTPRPWPLKGIRLLDPPKLTSVSTTVIAKGVSEGWVKLAGEQIVHRPGGPPQDLWRDTHTFRHAKEIVFKTLEGDVRYKVVHQPDKYVEGKPPTAKVTDEIYKAGDTRIDWFYRLELVG